MLKNKAFLGFSNTHKELGAIVEISYINKTVTLEIGEEEYLKTPIEDIVVLDEVGFLGGDIIFNQDVLVTSREGVTEKFYEVELMEDGNAVLHLLDKKLNRVKTGDEFPSAKISDFSTELELFGNKLMMLAELPQIDFNIKVVRQTVNGEIQYAYACNNKMEEEIDLIKVIYMGHQLIEEEDYERVTLSYEGYLDSIERGILKEVNPQELMNYVTGLTYGRKPQADLSITEEGINLPKGTFKVEADVSKGINLANEVPCDPEDIDYCEECGEYPEDCDCELWSDK